MMNTGPMAVLRRGLSIVVPVYNSEASLAPLLARLRPVLESRGIPYEIILVDDGSRDRSWAAIVALQAEDAAHIRGVRFMRNFGQHNALLCGIQKARYDVTVTMDDDLQHPPEELPVLLDALKDDYDVIYGSPRHQQHGFLRDLASGLTKLALQQAMGAETASQVSAFRVFRTLLRDGFAACRIPYANLDVLLTWSTTRFLAVAVRHDPRTLGVSNYSLGRLLRHAMNMITGFSILPLQLASLLGLGFALVGGAVLLYVLVVFALRGRVVPGFAFLASCIAIFSGAQLLALGIIGEYLARIHLRSLDRPVYTVRDQADAAVIEGYTTEGQI